MDVTLGVFLITYAAMAIGRVPGFRVDRTGAALLGAIALIVFERISPEAAWNAISFPTVALLFGLMTVSAAFSVAGFYDWAARWAATRPLSPPRLLAILILISAVFSSLVTNDVVVVAMVPLVVQLTLARGLNPVPFLLGFCFAANAGAVGTIIGSPQNMIIAQTLNLSFVGFMQAAAIPALLSLGIIWAVLVVMYRKRWHQLEPGMAPAQQARAAVTTASAANRVPDPRIALNVRETVKAGLVTLGVIAAFVFTDWPRELVALGAAGVLLINRSIASADLLKRVDGDLLILLSGLFIVNAALASTGLPQQILGDLNAHGLDLQHPLALLLATGVLSDIVGNNPAALLIVPYISGANPELAGAAMALGSGFASNIVIFGSLAGIIVVQAAQAHGVRISFSEFSLAGLPVTVLTMLLAVGWILVLA